MRHPDPKVMPKKNWGAKKNLLVKGYKMMNIAKKIEIFMVNGFVNISKIIDANPNMIKSTQASRIEIVPDANGLLAVRVTSLSIL